MILPKTLMCPGLHGSLTAQGAGHREAARAVGKWTDIFSSWNGTAISSSLEGVFFTAVSTVAIANVGTRKAQGKENPLKPNPIKRAHLSPVHWKSPPLSAPCL